MIINGERYLKIGPVPKPWVLPWWGRALERVGRHCIRWDVDETGEYRTIGAQGGAMAEAREAYAEAKKALDSLRQAVASLESDLANLLREFPGCDMPLIRKPTPLSSPAEPKETERG